MTTPTSEVHHGDCLEFMRRQPDNAFDLAICDPPYFSGHERRQYYGARRSKNGVRRTYHASPQWTVPDDEYFHELLRVARHYIIWGCNYFRFIFHPGRIVWDKCNGASSFSDCEIAATDLFSSVRLFRYMWNGMCQGLSIAEGHIQQGNKALNEVRIHPTQKPVALYGWMLTNFAKTGWHILDTHLGSGSSRIAAYRLGFDFTGCEIDPHYCQAAEERFQKEASATSPHHKDNTSDKPQSSTSYDINAYYTIPTYDCLSSSCRSCVPRHDQSDPRTTVA